MKSGFATNISLSDFKIWKKMEAKRAPISFGLEITGRCNNNCRHCYINLPAQDRKAKEDELTLSEIDNIAEGAVSLGAFLCLITGGEPLLREDFFDVYLKLKKRGLLVSVFTNATLITKEHVRFFRKYPPRGIEVTVYGVTPKTYERVSRQPGSFAAFNQGLNLLLGSGIKVRLKTMALRSNVQELPQIARFCREKTKDYFRFDPLLHLRFDRNPQRNAQIKAERLSAQEIVEIEQADSERSSALEKNCDKLIVPDFARINCNHLFKCGVGLDNFTVSYNGLFRLCASLWHPDCLYDLKKETLKEAWQNLVPRVREMCSVKKEFLEKCRRCELFNLCLWCPAHAYLEKGKLDVPVEYFCKVAHKRAEALGYNLKEANPC